MIGLRDLVPFLRYLGALPSSPYVARALVEGPLRAAHAGGATVYRCMNDQLRLVSAHGLAPSMRARYAAVQRTVSVPLTECLSTAGPVMVDTSRAPQHFSALSTDAELWHELAQQPTYRITVHMRLGDEVAPLGAFAFSVPDWPSDDEAAGSLRALAGALRLWMRTTEPEPLALPRDGAFGISSRQSHMLLLVEAGFSTDSIAVLCDCSPSTVKSELARAMRFLGAPTRDEAAARARALGLLPAASR